MDWFAYYRLALELVNEEDDAYKRSAVSRAYYAMYCTARDKLVNAGRFKPSKCESRHVYVWKTYKEDDEYPARVDVGRLGDRLRRKRIKADYHGFIEHFPDLVDIAMDEAEELKDYLQDPLLI